MVQNVTKVNADVLVVLAGTNDLGRRPFEESQENVAEIAATVGAPRVVVSAVPPLNKSPKLATDYNASMKAFVESKGWEWIDAMAQVRAGDVYAEGMTSDGTHPTPAAARLIGEAVNRALLAD
jgi:lysophospholipase L1-like esterase